MDELKLYIYVDVTNYIVHEGYKPSSIAFGGPRNGGLMWKKAAWITSDTDMEQPEEQGHTKGKSQTCLVSI